MWATQANSPGPWAGSWPGLIMLPNSIGVGSMTIILVSLGVWLIHRISGSAVTLLQLKLPETTNEVLNHSEEQCNSPTWQQDNEARARSIQFNLEQTSLWVILHRRICNRTDLEGIQEKATIIYVKATFIHQVIVTWHWVGLLAILQLFPSSGHD